MRVSFNWLKDYVDVRISPEALAEKLTMAGLEVTSSTPIEEDTILEIEVTPNRADCLSIVGIAREVAAILNKKLKLPKISSFRGKSHLGIPIQIQAKKFCQRYLGRAIRNVKVGPSPLWLVQRLEAMGIRAVNNIVDITNFCLLEFGQPLHAFDLDKLQGPKIVVRLAREAEEIVTIDGMRRQLYRDTLVIADKVHPQAIAGIMGAKATEVNEETKNILLESAYFDHLNIHHTSRKLGLATESSYRFERGVDKAGLDLCSLRATELIARLARPEKRKPRAIKIGKLIDEGKKVVRANRVRLNFTKVEKLLGAEIAPSQIKEALRRLEFTIVRKSKDGLTVEVPSFRADVGREVDLIEEIARFYGYDKIGLNISQLISNLSYTGRRSLFSEEVYNVVRQILATLGFNEILTYSLISRAALRKLELPSENAITVKNPLSYEQEILRPSLLAGMLNSLHANINCKNLNLQLFELSRVYHKKDGSGTEEPTNLCMAITGKTNDNWMRESGRFSFFDLKGAVQMLLDKLGVGNIQFAQAEHPVFVTGRCASILLGKESLGFLGEIKTNILERFDISYPVYACELAIHRSLTLIHQEHRFVPLARFPSVERDISLVTAQEIQCGEITAIINKIGGELIAEVNLFDQYFGEQIPSGFRGLAYTIKYCSKERTLTGEEVDKLHAQIRQALIEELKVQIR